MLGAALLMAVLTTPVPFTLVNRTGAVLSDIAVRPVGSAGGGTEVLRAAPISPGARADLPAAPGSTCSFDLIARVAGEPVTWGAVNLCDVKVVTLHRRPDGTAWADYD